MPWIQIKLETHADHAGELEDLLLAIGASAVTLEDSKDQPLYEPKPGATPLWRDTRVVGLFDASTDMELVVQFLKNEYPHTPFPQHRVEIVEDKDWEREWMTHFEPMQFGERLWVCPSWKEVPNPDAINLMLDPGLAFGTGTHPTTALCLKWLDGQNLDGKTVLDFGCGSGILGIAALLLGAEQMLGVDIDPQALEASAENARRNQLPAEKLSLYLPEQAPQFQADVLVANILAGPLMQLAEHLAAQVKPGAPIALSGILAEQAEDVAECYQQWFDLDPIAQQDDWVRISGIRKAS